MVIQIFGEKGSINREDQKVFHVPKKLEQQVRRIDQINNSFPKIVCIRNSNVVWIF